MALIKFKDGFLEYKNGEYYRKNDGSAFEVDGRFAADVLIASGVFELAAVPSLDVTVTVDANANTVTAAVSNKSKKKETK